MHRKEILRLRLRMTGSAQNDRASTKEEDFEKEKSETLETGVRPFIEEVKKQISKSFRCSSNIISSDTRKKCFLR